jgi:hypothetical protein
MGDPPPQIHRNLPSFQPPRKQNHHLDYHPNQQKQPTQNLALSKAEVEAVVSTFHTFATFAGVQARRKDLSKQSSKRIEDADFGRVTSSYKTSNVLTGLGDILNPKNKLINPAVNKQSQDTTWRSLVNGAGQRTYVEIVKQKEPSGKTKATPRTSKHSSKRLGCALCEHMFPKSQLTGRVCKMSVTRIQRKWKAAASSHGKNEMLFSQVKSVQDHLFRPSDYNLVSVCVLCMQFFHADEKEQEEREEREESEGKCNDDMRDHHTWHSTNFVPNKKEAAEAGSFSAPASSCTVVSGSVQSKYIATYRSSPTAWRGFKQNIQVSSRSPRSGLRSGRSSKERVLRRNQQGNQVAKGLSCETPACTSEPSATFSFSSSFSQFSSMTLTTPEGKNAERRKKMIEPLLKKTSPFLTSNKDRKRIKNMRSRN